MAMGALNVGPQDISGRWPPKETVALNKTTARQEDSSRALNHLPGGPPRAEPATRAIVPGPLRPPSAVLKRVS
jgi:hypothetical protein